MKRIGILGGTFNPIHRAHLKIAKCAKKQLNLDEVWFLPAGVPPHKTMEISVSPQDRVEMVRLAIAPYDAFSLCTIDAYKQKPCYTWETLKEIKENHKDDSLFFIIGGDSFVDFASWVKPEVICSYADIIVAKRAGKANLSEVDFLRLKEEYEEKFPAHFYELDIDFMDISSTDIRNRLMRGEDVSDVLPKKVLSYIKNNYLYMDIYEQLRLIQNDLKGTLKHTRYEHTMSVMYTAANLAYAHGYNANQAMLAGLLHDSAKNLSDEEKISICEYHDIAIRPIEYEQPQLLHGKVGAYIAKTTYHIYDEEILHAIEVHTTGCVAMSKLDLIIYIADYIEPWRNKATNLEEIRRLAYIDLETCAYHILKDTYHYLMDQHIEMDPVTKEAYLYYKKLQEKEE